MGRTSIGEAVQQLAISWQTQPDELLVLGSSEAPSELDTIGASSRTLGEVFLIDRLNDQSIGKAKLRVGLGEGLELSCVCSGPRWG